MKHYYLIFVNIMQNQIIYLQKVIYVKNVDVTSVKVNNGLNLQSVKNGAVSKKLFKERLSGDDDNDQTEQKTFLYEHLRKYLTITTKNLLRVLTYVLRQFIFSQASSSKMSLNYLSTYLINVGKKFLAYINHEF